MMDTSAFVAALVERHEHHDLARPHLRADMSLSVIVVAETYSVLRRVFGQSARVASQLVGPWASDSLLVPTSARAMTTALARASELDLAGNIHDALISLAALETGASMVTLDTRQHRIALALGANSTFLLA
jgi:predicted nucleic acid-binding protein